MLDRVCKGEVKVKKGLQIFYARAVDIVGKKAERSCKIEPGQTKRVESAGKIEDSLRLPNLFNDPGSEISRDSK